MTTQSMAARIVAGVHAGERLELGKRPLAALRHLGFTVAAVATPPVRCDDPVARVEAGSRAASTSWRPGTPVAGMVQPGSTVPVVDLRA